MGAALGRFRAIVLVTMVLGFSPGAPAMAQDETLADIRQELSILYVDLQRLKRELSTTGGASAPLGAGTALERVNQIEAELVRLTAKTEQLENRINSVVQDGTNRVGDLEFRLVELEGGDVSTLGETTTLGGDVANPVATTDTPTNTTAPELAMGEQADFDRARAALDSEDYNNAAQLFAAFTDTYTGGPLTAEAHYFRGAALFGLGDTANAARAYLESFSGSPNSQRAPDALLGLGISLGELGQINEACISLREIAVRFAGASAVDQATIAMQDLSCP